VVVSVGVMEHFLNDSEATKEIFRVLKPGGSYVALIHTEATRADRIRQKIREYIFPRPRPIALLKWVAKKTRRPIHQPLQKHYTLESGKACMVESGFDVERVITYFDRPKAPLAGPHVVIYISRRPALQ
jgi:SAM-dependent methyltransferase